MVRAMCRFEERAAPAIIHPTDATIRLSATCVCGSDSVAVSRELQPVTEPTPMGHEYCGVCRGGRQRGQNGQTWPIRYRFVLRLRQYVSALPCRISDVLSSTRSSSVARKRRCCAFRSRTALWWRRRRCRRARLPFDGFMSAVGARRTRPPSFSREAHSRATVGAEEPR